MSRDLPVRRTGPQVRRPPVRRASPLLSTLQLCGLVVMVASVAGIWSIAASPQFAARKIEIQGARFTSGEVVRTLVGLDRSVNLFGLQTDRAAQQLVKLPAVETAQVEVRLPDTVVVTLRERTPKMFWVIGDRRYVVDENGVLFGLVDSAGNPIPSTAGPIESAPTPLLVTPAPTPTWSGSTGPGGSKTPLASPTVPPTATPAKTATPKPGKTAGGSPSTSPAGPSPRRSSTPSLQPVPTADPAATPGGGALMLPVVFDRQAADAPLGLGSVVDPIALDAGYRLAGRSPAEVGSSARALTVVVDDDHGFTMSSVPPGWVAEFGFYTPTLRKDTVIPNQIGDLRSLLLGTPGEAHVAWVRLMADISEDHVNTYTPR